MSALVCLVALLAAVSAQLQCPGFSSIPIESQPIIVGAECNATKPAAGICMGEGPFICSIGSFFAQGAISIAESTPIGIECTGVSCAAAGQPCECENTAVCLREIGSADVGFICFDGPTTSPTTTEPPENFCDEDDDLSVDCTEPQDRTFEAVLIGVGALLIIVMFVVCCCARPRRVAHLE